LIDFKRYLKSIFTRGRFASGPPAKKEEKELVQITSLVPVNVQSEKMWAERDKNRKQQSSGAVPENKTTHKIKLRWLEPDGDPRLQKEKRIITHRWVPSS